MGSPLVHHCTIYCATVTSHFAVSTIDCWSHLNWCRMKCRITVEWHANFKTFFKPYTFIIYIFLMAIFPFNTFAPFEPIRACFHYGKCAKRSLVPDLVTGSVWKRGRSPGQTFLLPAPPQETPAGLNLQT